MRVLVGALIAGVILYLVPGLHSGPACLAAGALLTFLLLQLGPSSVVEKLGATLTVALLAWIAGPRAATGQSLIWHLLGWTIAGSALAFYLRPRTE
ncbi:MAG TPA: hypothetical protein VN915_17735 [Elusimicrobiota bacterium]|nr:hypothetical protein [Elusimicrobiota bacterium]